MGKGALLTPDAQYVTAGQLRLNTFNLDIEGWCEVPSDLYLEMLSSLSEANGAPSRNFMTQ